MVSITPGAGQGQIQSDAVDGRSWLLLAAHVGIMIVAAEDPGGPEGRAMTDGLRTLVTSWVPPAADPQGVAGS